MFLNMWCGLAGAGAAAGIHITGGGGRRQVCPLSPRGFPEEVVALELI